MPFGDFLLGPKTPKPKIFGDIKDWTGDYKAGDTFWKDNPYAKEGWYPIWMQPQDKTQKLLDQSNNPTGGSGLDYKYFGDLLKDMIAKGDPNQAIYRQAALGDVNKGYDRGAITLRENLAGSGMLRSGVGQNAFATLEGGRQNAIAGVDTQLAARDQSFRQNALKNLLGLFGQESSQGQSWKEFLLNLQNNQNQFDWQKNFTEENTADPLGQILGNIFSGLATGAGAIIASDKRLKENIEKVGKTKSGLPIVKFNYKDKPNVTFKGHIAQDVEKKYPNAVFKFIDYNKLPGDAIFKVVN